VNDVSANKAGIDKLVSELNSQHGDNAAIGVAADVTSSAEVKKMIEESVEKLGPLTVMVANAGIAQVQPILEIPDDDVKKMFDVNFMGVWNW
jgi:NAD(P)-dependent dehydrogenase (short-subunit alcohol dehydrogenase family)